MAIPPTTKVTGILFLTVLILLVGCNKEPIIEEEIDCDEVCFKEWFNNKFSEWNLTLEIFEYDLSIGKYPPSESIKETNFPCAEGRECIDVCDGTLLVMEFGECKTGCTMYKGKLVGAYELQYALENCEVSVNSSQHVGYP